MLNEWYFIRRMWLISHKSLQKGCSKSPCGPFTVVLRPFPWFLVVLSLVLWIPSLVPSYSFAEALPSFRWCFTALSLILHSPFVDASRSFHWFFVVLSLMLDRPFVDALLSLRWRFSIRWPMAFWKEGKEGKRRKDMEETREEGRTIDNTMRNIATWRWSIDKILMRTELAESFRMVLSSLWTLEWRISRSSVLAEMETPLEARRLVGLLKREARK